MFDKMNNTYAFPRWHFSNGYYLFQTGYKSVQWEKIRLSDPCRCEWPNRKIKVCHRIMNAENKDNTA